MEIVFVGVRDTLGWDGLKYLLVRNIPDQAIQQTNRQDDRLCGERLRMKKKETKIKWEFGDKVTYLAPSLGKLHMILTHVSDDFETFIARSCSDHLEVGWTRNLRRGWK